MRRRRILLIIGLIAAVIVIGVVLAAVVASRVMANRDVVKTFIVDTTARSTGGELDYDRLEVGFLPLPHVKVRNLLLQRQDRFVLRAAELWVFLKILPIFRGELRFNRMALAAPRVTIHLPDAGRPSPDDHTSPTRGLEAVLSATIKSLFAGAAAIGEASTLAVDDGSLTLAFTNAPDMHIERIDGRASREHDRLSVHLECRSDLTGRMTIEAESDIQTRRADGRITIAALNLRPLLIHAGLPGGIGVDDTRGEVMATVALDADGVLRSNYDLRLPSLTVKRNARRLTLETMTVTGGFNHADGQLSLSVKKLQSARPPLDLSAEAVMASADAAGRSTIQLTAAADALDVSVAGQVTRAVAGDLNAIQTAFDVAREGRLTDVSFRADLADGPVGWQATRMDATGHLNGGLVTLPGMDADLQEMAGDVHYRDQRVDFMTVSGRFKGAAFERLTAAIDWSDTATLAIASPTAMVDTTLLYDWLTGFDALAVVKTYVASVEGKLRLSRLSIDGPLTDPAAWRIDISGTPEKIRLATPKLPFPVGLSGGEITYTPDSKRASGVQLTFLDGTLTTDFRSTGIVRADSMSVGFDGSLGSRAIDWLMTILPIPDRLRPNPPVELAGVVVDWSVGKTVTVTGNLKTAGGVDLFADATVAPRNWQIRRLAFADGISRADVSLSRTPSVIALSFAGTIEKGTADRLLDANRVLSGRLEGDFRARINTQAPADITFDGRLAGEGLHIRTLVPQPIDIGRFALRGEGDRITIDPSTLSLINSHMVVDGGVVRRGDILTIDLNVAADRLDNELIEALVFMGKDDDSTANGPVNRPQGVVHLQADEFAYAGFTWSPVAADIRLDRDAVTVQITRADLCGISTPGTIAVTPRGMSLQITPSATDASLQATAECLWPIPITAKVNYDLAGAIQLPATRQDPLQAVTGRLQASSQKGRIIRGNILMKILSVLNLTEVFAGGQSDLVEEGYGFNAASISAGIGGGELTLEEILFDGNSLKITGQGGINLLDRSVDVMLLAAPLKTVDRIINKIPVINYIAGGSLVSIPLRVHGKVDNLKVEPIPPAAVGQGLLHLMGRTLKAPFKLVEDAAALAETAAKTPAPPRDTKLEGP